MPIMPIDMLQASPIHITDPQRTYHQTSPGFYSRNIFQIEDPVIGLQWLETLNPSLMQSLGQIDLYVRPAYHLEWPALLNKLSTEAVGLQVLDVFLVVEPSANQWGAALDVEFVRALGRFQDLSTMELRGWFPKEWPEYLESKTGLDVFKESEHEGWYLKSLRRFQSMLDRQSP